MSSKLTKNFSLTLERPFVHFGTFVKTHPINLKLCQNIEDIILTKNHEKKMPIYLAISQKWPFENSKIAKISKITIISKLSERDENFFRREIFIVDFEYELRIKQNFEIKPVGANLSIFRTFASYYPITHNIENAILNNNQGKKWQY